jgi:glycosyltransferase involved in cell wall biosynthesis
LQKEANSWQQRELGSDQQLSTILFIFLMSKWLRLANWRPRPDVRTLPLYVLEPVELARTETPTPELLFVAGFNHPPNIDAAIWFVESILPSLRDKVPGLKLHIAGSNPSKAVLELACNDVTVHGYVSDEKLIALYGRAACAVVPLRFGAGVKGKVLEAIRYGVPLVTTSIGAEGIPDALEVMRVADEPEFFAQAVLDDLQGGAKLRVIAKLGWRSTLAEQPRRRL